MSCRVRLAAALLAFPVPLAAEDARLLPPVVGAAETLRSDPRSGLALSGYDPVSYQLDGRPRPGSPAHEVLRDGAVWRMASAANRAAFLRDPGRFAPRLGGYDALAAASGRIAGADATVFLLRDGRLYLFRSPERRDRFAADPDAEDAAERAWPALAQTLVRP